MFINLAVKNKINKSLQRESIFQYDIRQRAKVTLAYVIMDYQLQEIYY